MQRRGRKLSEINLRRVTAAPRNCCQVMTRIIIITSCTERMGTYGAYLSDMEMQMCGISASEIFHVSPVAHYIFLFVGLSLIYQTTMRTCYRMKEMYRTTKLSDLNFASKSPIRKNPASRVRTRAQEQLFVYVIVTRGTTGELSRDIFNDIDALLRASIERMLRQINYGRR